MELASIAWGELAEAWVEAEMAARAAEGPYGQCAMRKAALAARVAEEAAEACRDADCSDYDYEVLFLRECKAEKAAEAWAEAAGPVYMLGAAVAELERDRRDAVAELRDVDLMEIVAKLAELRAQLAAALAEEAAAALAAREAEEAAAALDARIAEAVKAALAARDADEEKRALLKAAKVAAKNAAKKARRAARAAAAAPPPDTTLELDEPPAGAQGAPAADGSKPALPDTTLELDEPPAGA
jgi:hypothetical protein